MSGEFPMRMQRYLARSGLGSRRKCEELIDDGRVTLNGKVVSEKGVLVNQGDIVMADGRKVSPIPFRYFILNKPEGIISVNDDSRGRTWVVDLIPDGRKLGLFPAGRLDLDTTGLMLITNDGRLANRIMHPRYGIRKEYRALVKGTWTPDTLRSRLKGKVVLENGEVVDGIEVVSAFPESGDTRTVITIHEGRKHVVKRLFTAIGTRVLELERTAIGSLRAPYLEKGQWKEMDRTGIERALLS